MIEDISYYRNNTDSLRIALNSNEIKKPRAIRQILLVDDDPCFSHIMQRAAEIKGIVLKTCASIQDIEKLGKEDFDVVVADYLLEGDTGLHIATFLGAKNLNIPIILISQTARIPRPKEWPDNIREFVHKKLGPYAILDAVIEAYEINELYKKTKTLVS